MHEGTQVYFMQEQRGGRADNNLIKIGISKDVVARRVMLERERQCSLMVLATFPGSYEEEQKLHAYFSQYRVIGEWFRPCENILRIVKSNTLPALPDLSVRALVSTYLYLDEDAWETFRRHCRARISKFSIANEIMVLVTNYLKEWGPLPSVPDTDKKISAWDEEVPAVPAWIGRLSSAQRAKLRQRREAWYYRKCQEKERYEDTLPVLPDVADLPMTHVTLRLDEGVWLAFRAHCRARKTSCPRELTKLVTNRLMEWGLFPSVSDGGEETTKYRKYRGPNRMRPQVDDVRRPLDDRLRQLSLPFAI